MGIAPYETLIGSDYTRNIGNFNSWEKPAPGTAATGRLSTSKSAAQIDQLDLENRAATGARSSHISRRSRLSAASMRSSIAEMVQREVEKEMQMSSERTAFQDYLLEKEAKIQRKRDKAFAMPPHLRVGPNPVEMGCPNNYLTESMRALQGPVQMAVDPKWSTDLKKMNDRVGSRIEYERRISASVTGGMAPQANHMYPKRYLSNPPTPYFVPGKKE